MSTLMGHHKSPKRNLNFSKSQMVLNMCKNISEEVLLAASKNQAKTCTEDCFQGWGPSFTLPLRRKENGTLFIA